MEPALKRTATGRTTPGESVLGSVLLPHDILRTIGCFSDVFTLGALEICCRELKEVRHLLHQRLLFSTDF
jgi:hypothetical protein